MFKALGAGQNFLQVISGPRNSSTDLQQLGRVRASTLTELCGHISPNRREVRLIPMACIRHPRACGFYVPVEARGERIESVGEVNPQLSNSNRKDTHKDNTPPLFNRANTCRIRSFADQQRQKSAAADDGLMDRGAECAAGGIDVI
jgi:hypothetical protein